MIQQISNSELILMKIIWDKGGKTFYAQIADSLSEMGYTWQKNTIITLLSRLNKKGFLETKKVGHRNEYIALISELEYQGIQTKKLLNELYEGNASGLINTLIQKNMLTFEDYEELKRFWEGVDDGK